MAMLKIFSLLSVLAAIIVGAYLYVSHVNTSTQSGGSPSSATESAGNAVDNFNGQSQKNLQKAQGLNQ
jgi:uncharacterized protein (UPF0333 family)